MVGYEHGGFKLFGDNNVISSGAPGSQGVLERARTNALALLSQKRRNMNSQCLSACVIIDIGEEIV